MPDAPSALPQWHLLQASDVLDLELAAALTDSVPLTAWQPKHTFLLWIAKITDLHNPHYPTVRIKQFPLLRGYARPPLSAIARTGSTLTAMLLKQTPDPRNSPLICTVPYFASVAECWPGPVIYWLTDLITEYTSARGIDIPALDRRMCRAATLVCPNSERLAGYLTRKAACDPEKIHILPNATRTTNLLPAPPQSPADLPPDLQHLRRPIAGVIGNLAGNMDWLLLQGMIEQTEHLSWVFVGPTAMPIPDPAQAAARAAVLAHPATHFVGKKPYGDLARYARAFDVAVLPYLRGEPTYSGSSTRFYEHLAASRPMLATSGLEELTRKVPLLRLIATVPDGVAGLQHLQNIRFDDGLTHARWAASQVGTWHTRAQSMQDALALRLPLKQPGPAHSQ